MFCLQSRAVVRMIALAIVCATMTSTVNAQDSMIQLWEYPGTHPLEADREDAAKLFARDHGILEVQFWQGITNFDEGKCEDRFLQDGEIITTSFTVNDIDKTKTLMVAFKYPEGHELAGQSLPEDHPDRKAKSCSMGRADGAELVYPLACENWSIQTRPMVPEDQVPLRACRRVVERSVTQNTLVLSGGFAHSACNCTKSSFVPSLGIILEDPTQSTTVYDDCAR